MRGVCRRKLGHQLPAGVATAIVIIRIADHDPDGRIDQIGEVRVGDVVKAPADRIKRRRGFEVDVRAEYRIAVAAGHHEHCLACSHRAAHEADSRCIDVRARGEQAIGSADIGEIVSEIFGPLAGSADRPRPPH
jgi:hypothetical protein